MNTVAFFLAAGLALVFAWAALAKLRSPRRTAEGFAALHLPWPRALAWVVPGLELVTAAALVLRPAWGAPIAFALLAGFTVLLVDIIRRGIPAACYCFGSGGDRPVDRRTLYRNAILLGVALAVVAIG